MLDCQVVGHCTKCCVSLFFEVECHAEARASAISSAVEINFCSLVKTRSV